MKWLMIAFVVLSVGLSELGGNEVKAAPACSTTQINNMKTASTTPYEVDCNPTFNSSDVIRRPLLFTGLKSNDVTFNCNGASIQIPVSIREDVDSITVLSEKQSGQPFGYARAQDILVKNCKVYGAVRIKSTYFSNGLAGPKAIWPKTQTTPTRITFDNLDVENYYRRNAIYFEQGTTFSQLLNSKIIHKNKFPSMYISVDSAWNIIENNEFHHTSTENREIIALDGAEGNKVLRNWFSGLTEGGVYLYRNCGEGGGSRMTPPSGNRIDNNIFYYKKYKGSNPGVYIGSRANEKVEKDLKNCPLDSSEPHYDSSDLNSGQKSRWGSDWESSSTDDRDFARYNFVRSNKVCNRDPDDVFKVQIPNFNHSNTIKSNTRIVCNTSSPIPR